MFLLEVCLSKDCSNQYCILINLWHFSWLYFNLEKKHLPRLRRLTNLSSARKKFWSALVSLLFWSQEISILCNTIPYTKFTLKWKDWVITLLWPPAFEEGLYFLLHWLDAFALQHYLSTNSHSNTSGFLLEILKFEG